MKRIDKLPTMAESWLINNNNKKIVYPFHLLNLVIEPLILH